jgi:predicted esterase
MSMTIAALAGCGSPTPTIAPAVPPATISPPTAAATLTPIPVAQQYTVNSSEIANGVVVEDVTFDRNYRDAFVVRPDNAGPRSAAGILFFHWVEYGSPTSNRTEFLEEAKALASRGVVSVLVDGTFPWHEPPESIEHDTTALNTDLEMARRAYEVLLSRPEVDRARTALVGHDFGSMYESVVFAEDERPIALVMMAPTARWADWFYRYWQISDEEEAYKAALAPFDPVTALPNAADRPILLQFAELDQYVPADVAEEISAAAGSTAETRKYDASHELDEAARADRDEWLATILGLD